MKFEKIILACILLISSFLMLYQIDRNPPGLYIDEVSIAHNAYKILTTGKDEYGVSYPLWFKSFGDYKMPVYVYSVAGAMALFGKNELAVRIPSAVAGIVSILVVYVLVKNLVALDRSLSSTYKKYLPLLSAFLLAFSTWHIHFSRGGFEVNMGLCFYLLGALLFSFFLRDKRSVFLFLGVIVFLLSMYTYHSFRVAAPLTVLLSLGYFYWKFAKVRSSVVIAGIVFIVGIVPIVQFSLTKEGSERFAQTSAFSEYKATTPFEKLATYPLVYIKNFLSFFSLNFLFSNGDGNGRHQIASFGLFYLWEFVFLLFGIYTFVKKKKSYLFYVVIGMLILAALPAALSRPSPHSLRPLLMVVPLTILIAVGILSCLSIIKKFAKPLIVVVIVIGLFEFVYTAHFYTQHYPKVNLLDWGAGYKDVVIESAALKDKYPKIYVDGKLSDIKTYYDFYGEDVQYEFVPQTWIKPEEFKNKKVLYIRPNYGVKNDPKIIKNIIFPNVNKDIFAQFWEL